MPVGYMTRTPINNISTKYSGDSPYPEIKNGNMQSQSESSLMPGYSDTELPTSTHCRRVKRLIPNDQKDNRYWDKRKRNNEAAKKSREVKRLQETGLRARLTILEQENAMLRQEVAQLRQQFDTNETRGNNNCDINATRYSHMECNEYKPVSPPTSVSYNPSMSMSASYNSAVPMREDQHQNYSHSHHRMDDLQASKMAPNHCIDTLPFRQYTAPFGFYVAAYGQPFRYPPMKMDSNNDSYQPAITPPGSDRSNVSSPAQPPKGHDAKQTENVAIINSQVPYTQEENVNLKNKLRDIGSAVAYMSRLQITSEIND